MFETVVCATESRKRQAVALCDRIRWAHRAPGLTVDCAGEPTVNHAKAWRLGLQIAESSGADWVVVIEDDALVTDNYGPLVTSILEAAPSDVVSLYLGTGVPAAWQGKIGQALQFEPSWVVSTQLMSHVAVAARVDQIAQIIAYLEAKPNLACDTVLSVGLSSSGALVSYPVPSPVDHADGETTVDHLIPEATKVVRRAWRFGDSWSDGSVHALDARASRRLAGAK